MPVPIVNIKVKEAHAIPVACEALLKVPNDADKVTNILSK